MEKIIGRGERYEGMKTQRHEKDEKHRRRGGLIDEQDTTHAAA